MFVCGKPSSGNHLIRRHIQRCGQSAGFQMQVSIWHGLKGHEPDVFHDQSPKVIVPTRNEAIRQLSLERRNRGDGLLSQAAVLAFVLEHDLPLLRVFYEDLVKEPDRIGRELMEWLDIPWTHWPGKKTGNHHGAVFDANWKYCHQQSE